MTGRSTPYRRLPLRWLVPVLCLHSAITLGEESSELNRTTSLIDQGWYEEALKELSQIEGTENPVWQYENGRANALSGEPAQAAPYFAACYEQFVAASAFAEASACGLNELRARVDSKNLIGLTDRVERLEIHLSTNAATAAHAPLWIGFADLITRSMMEFRLTDELQTAADRVHRRAIALATDDAHEAWANGIRASLAMQQGDSESALQHARRAAFLAQAQQQPDQLYRWEWLTGRALLAAGEQQAAQRALERAVHLLDTVKSNFVRGSYRTFEHYVDPVYRAYAGAALTNAASMPEGAEKQVLLTTVRDRLEELKRTEIEDYFSQECLPPNEENQATLTENTAVIYPILLEDRVEVLLEVSGRLRQFAAPVSKNRLVHVTRQLRLALERTALGDDYLPISQSIYEWLIRPAEAALNAQGVKTLVVIPDGALRTVPFAALHDGNQFLIERYAIATTPAVQLTRSQRRTQSSDAFVGGISKAVQGFSQLPAAREEIRAVASMFEAKPLEDERFTRSEVANGLGAEDLSVVHFATHGEFNGNYLDSFLLTYDGRLTLPNLRAVLSEREASIDLLVLSACQTAAGDDRAALGLAGVAVQSGAASALASLWSVSDEATALLTQNFYTAHHKNDLSKAESLRVAQTALLARDKYRHPAYWAPYLLVGAWE